MTDTECMRLGKDAILLLLILLFILLGAGRAVAQSQSVVTEKDSEVAKAGPNDPNNSYDIGLHFGPLLPNRISKVRDIIPGWGVRLAAPTAKGIFELELYHGQGSGIVYRTASFDYRLDIPNPYLPTHFILGMHADLYSPPNLDSRYAGGWHYGGGITEEIAGPLLLRADFKYRYGPGESLYVGVGLLYRIQSGSGGP